MRNEVGNFEIRISDDGYGGTAISVDTLPETKLAVAELLDIVLGYGGPGTTLTIRRCVPKVFVDSLDEVPEEAEESERPVGDPMVDDGR